MLFRSFSAPGAAKPPMRRAPEAPAECQPEMMDRNPAAAAHFAVAVVLLVLSFYGNFFGVVDEDWFLNHQRLVEGQIAGRMMVAEQDGLFSHGGFTGLCGSNLPGRQHQDELYIQGARCLNYKPYRSQVGLQATSFAIFDRLTPFDRATTWNLIQFITACFTAFFVALFLTWLGAEFGHVAYVAALAATLFSPWMTVFGRMIYWVSGVFYLPLVAVIFIEWQSDSRPAVRPARVFALVGAAVLLKCLFNGYEYMTTTLFMMVTPVIYIAYAEGWSLVRTARRGLLYGVAGISGILISMLILSIQIAAVHRDGFAGGVRHIVESYQKRSHGDPGEFPKKYKRSLDASTMKVLSMYRSGTAFGIGRSFEGQHPEKLSRKGRFTYDDLIALFAIASALALLLASRLPRDDGAARRLRALVVTTWFAALAPLSWFVIFKAHSYVHTHINFLTWHMPFVPIGAALCGLVVAVAIDRRSVLFWRP